MGGKKRKAAKPPAEVLVLMEKDAGKGVSQKFEDTAFWLPNHVVSGNGAWFEAMIALDQHGNGAPLLALMEKQEVPEPVRPHLADLLRRHLPKQRRRDKTGKPRRTKAVKSYNVDDEDARLLLANAQLKAMVRAGIKRDDAVETVAALCDVKPNRLRNVGHNRSINRLRKRYPSLKDF